MSPAVPIRGRMVASQSTTENRCRDRHTECSMAALRAQIAAGVFRVEPTYQPHPRTWLSQERWEDEVGVDSRVMRLAEAWRLACKNGNDAAKGMVKKDAAQMGIAWRDVAAEVVRAKADF